MGVELELYVLVAILILGSSVFAVFEVETAGWRKALKWLIISVATIGLYYAAGHVALALPIGLAALGALFHTWWCRRHGIHPIHATPRPQVLRVARMVVARKLSFVRCSESHRDPGVDDEIGFGFAGRGTILHLHGAP